MMRKMKTGVLVVVMLLAMSGASLAGALSLPDGGLTIRGAETSLTLFELIPLGRTAEGKVDALSGGRRLTLDPSALEGVMSEADIEALPDESQMQTYARGSKEPEVMDLQGKLVALELLNSADGDYGGMTVAAVQALQAMMGMEQTGELDPPTQLALDLAMQSTLPDPAKAPVEQDISLSVKLADLDARLAPMSLVPAGDDGSFAYEYDDMTDDGALWQPVCCAIEVSDGRQIDQRAIEVRLGILLKGEGSAMTLTPVMRVYSKGTARLYLEEVLVKAGDKRVTLIAEEAIGRVEGVQIAETVDLPLDAQALAALANAAEAGELRLRIVGKNDATYNAELDQAARQLVARYVAVCGQVGL